MDFSKIIVRSYEILKKHRYLLWIGILAGLTEGGFGANIPNLYNTFNYKIPPKTPDASTRYLLNNWHHVLGIAWPYLVVAIGGIFLLILVIIYLGNASRGALIQIANNIEEGRHHKKSFSEYFAKGIPFIWRLFCLDFFAGLIIFLSILILIVPIIIVSFIHSAAVLILISGMIALIGMLIIFILAIYLGIIVKYASRIIVLEDVSTLEAFKKARQILHLQAENSLVAMLINIGLGIAFAIALFIAIIFIALLLFGLGYALYIVTNTWVVVTYGIIAGLALFLSLIIISGAFSAFISTYWTLTYRAAKYLAHKRQRSQNESR